jgi:hypothetical protein
MKRPLLGTVSHRAARRLTALLIAPVLVIGITGCGDNGDGAQGEAQAATGDSSGTAEPTRSMSPDDADPPEPSPEPASLTSGDALEAGLSGELAIQCVYHFDADEVTQQELFSMNGWVSPVADIYVDRDVVYWEIPKEQEGNLTSHVLGTETMTYEWKTPGNGTGITGDSGTNEDGAELADRMRTHARDCAPYTGTLSIFEPDPTILYK